MALNVWVHVMIIKPSVHYIPSASLAAQPLDKISTALAKDFVPPVQGNAIALRLRELIVLDNFDGIFESVFGGSNEIKLVSLVNDGTGAEPFKFEVGAFPGVKPRQPLPLGDKGLLLYYAEPQEHPKYIDWRLLVIEDDSDVRNAGLVLREVQKSVAYKDILSKAAALVNPTLGAVIEVTNLVIDLVAGLMEQNSDDVVSLFAATYTRAFDRLGVGTHTFHQAGRSRAKYEILAP